MATAVVNEKPQMFLPISKTCSKCGELKNLVIGFFKRKAGKLGYESICKMCTNERKDAWRRLDPQRHCVRHRNWRIRNAKSSILSHIKYKCKRLNIEFSITQDDIIIPNTCPILGISIFAGSGVPGPNSPSVDRLDPFKGYVSGNVWVISHKANAMKQDATSKELLAFANWAIHQYA